ncbi:hypothetical protein RHMOL_Rhmol02G0244800 [Rhododendron molle]|uniref:Uncharacterized protein n=1 Tax=Rhododendron molle TaxID=49168 RepID=A0ACC0PTC6_RHOML|nr:hypothetical protein RHMOL_Rhmol02G0244800 [Rhododendron molle]
MCTFLQVGITQVLSIIDCQHQPWLNGLELLEDAEQNKHILSSGCERSLGNQKVLQRVLKSIECHSVFDIFTLLDLLHQLKPNLISQTGDRVQLLIVDSISSLITPILGGGGSHGRALMIYAGSLLKKLAHEHNLAVLVTNHMVSGEGGTHKPALGESWKSIPHVRLELSREHGSNMCVVRHPCMASGKAVTFMIP